MKRFACGEVIPGCGMLFEEESVEAMVAEVASHTCEDHGMAVIDDATIQRIIASIYNAHQPIFQT